MPSTKLSGRRRRLAVAIATNAAPVVGVLALDWSIAALLVLYWLELGVDLGYGAIRGLFAGRPPEHDGDPLLVGALANRRGRIGLPGTDLGVQIANVPILLVGVPVFGLVWLVVGTVAIGAAGQGLPANPIDGSAAVTILVGFVGVVVARGYQTVSEYFLTGAYESASVQRALWSGIGPTFVVGGAMIAGGVGTAGGVPAAVAVVATVVGKFLLDLVDVYRDRIVAFDERDRVDLGFASEPDEWGSVAGEQSGPVRSVRSSRPALLLDGVVRGLSVPAVWFLFACVAGLAGIAHASGPGGGERIGAVAVGLLVAFAAFGVTDRVIRSLGMEYRVGADVVGYDRLFGRAQWRVPAWKFERYESDRTVADRLLGTETLVVEHDGQEIRVPHLPDATALTPADPSAVDDRARSSA